jgi:hypothetical protein
LRNDDGLGLLASLDVDDELIHVLGGQVYPWSKDERLVRCDSELHSLEPVPTFIGKWRLSVGIKHFIS